jgi:hypothetical protein
VSVSIEDIGAVANLLAAIGVLLTLIYLARQVRQGNLFARAQARQRMAEQAHSELYEWKHDPALRACFVKKELLTPDEQELMHYFLLAAMRAREWEWFQYMDGVISRDVYEAYHGVIALHLGTPRTRNWWKTVGRVGFDPRFAAIVDQFIEGRPPTDYFERIRAYDAQTS